MTPEEFRKIILPEGRRLYSFAFRYLNNREEAEDAVQEVMLKLWTQRNILDNHSNHTAWCTTVIRNYCIDILRKNRKMRAEEINDAGMLIADDTDPLERSVNVEAADIISRIVNCMKEPYKSAVILREMEGYSYEETSEAMNISVNTLRTILSRARKSIREEMKKIYSHGTE